MISMAKSVVYGVGWSAQRNSPLAFLLHGIVRR
jgi:hypothetical protein